ncbi:MAG: hypothetical protein L6Q54_10615 [Leptospiraceae bacterium]|nr:hypothetical protein [Leptospiraceae bacterium]
MANFGLSPIRIIGGMRNLEPDMEWMAYRAEEELNKILYFEKIEDAKKDLSILVGTGMIHGKDRGRFIDLKELSNLTKKYGEVGILFGREDKGLSRKSIDNCDFMVDFDLPGNQPSMNLSHSVAYTLGAIYNSSENSLAGKNIPNLNKNHFYSFSKEIFELLDMNNFHGSEDLAVKRFKSILDSRPLRKGDLDFLYKIFHLVKKRITENS